MYKIGHLPVLNLNTVGSLAMKKKRNEKNN